MNIFTRSCFTVIAAMLMFVLNASSQIVYKDSKSVLTIGKHIDFFIDSTSSQTLQSIQQQKKFIKPTADVPDLGLLKVPVWLKIQVTNKTADPNITIEFDQSFLDSIRFYYPSNGKYLYSEGGESFPFSSRATNYHKFIYNLNIPPDSTYTYYARIKSTHQMQMPIFLGAKVQVEQNSLTKNIFFGIFFGIILVMFFYNLFVYFSVKDSIYVYYVLYILVVGLIQATIEGYSFQFLWPNNSFLATRSFFLLTAFVNITGLEFVRKFLHTKQFVPKLDKIAYVLYLIYAVDIILTLTGNFYISYQILQSFAGLVSIYAGYIC
jgi:hypothetical protein